MFHTANDKVPSLQCAQLIIWSVNAWHVVLGERAKADACDLLAPIAMGLLPKWVIHRDRSMDPMRCALLEWIQGTTFDGILLLGVTIGVVGGLIVTRSNLLAGHLEGLRWALVS